MKYIFIIKKKKHTSWPVFFWRCRRGRILESTSSGWFLFKCFNFLSLSTVQYQPKKRCRSLKIKWGTPLLLCPCRWPVSYRIQKQCKQKQLNCTIRLTLCFHTHNCLTIQKVKCFWVSIASICFNNVYKLYNGYRECSIWELLQTWYSWNVISMKSEITYTVHPNDN